MTKLSNDALVFGLAYLNGPKGTLSFGGRGALNRLTSRARAALDELIAAGFVEKSVPDTSIEGREYYRGVLCDPHLGAVALATEGFDPFNPGEDWKAFEPVALPTMDDLSAEFAKFPVGNRDASGQRFGQHICNKFGYEFENSYQIEDKRECLAVLVRGLK